MVAAEPWQQLADLGRYRCDVATHDAPLDCIVQEAGSLRLVERGIDERLHRRQVSRSESEAAFGRSQVAIWRPTPSAHIEGGVRPVLPHFHPQTFVLIDRKRCRPDLC
jgi:hypothetical protein